MKTSTKVLIIGGSVLAATLIGYGVYAATSKKLNGDDGDFGDPNDPDFQPPSDIKQVMKGGVTRIQSDAPAGKKQTSKGKVTISKLGPDSAPAGSFANVNPNLGQSAMLSANGGVSWSRYLI